MKHFLVHGYGERVLVLRINADHGALLGVKRRVSRNIVGYIAGLYRSMIQLYRSVISFGFVVRLYSWVTAWKDHRNRTM